MRLLDALGAYRRTIWRTLARIPLGARRQCNICKQKVQRFLPYRRGSADVPPLLRSMGMVGSDVENFECPACGCHDRERHLLMYLEASELLSLMQGARILHLAPEQHLRRIIRAAGPLEYVLGDLHPTEPEIGKMDLQALEYPANYFDFVLANHVLEHVQDDTRALGEIFRVLKPGGHAILQTPYSRVLTRSFDDPGIEDACARLHAYGQADHRRLYGRNIVQAFTLSGARSRTRAHSEILSGVDAIRSGVNSDEPFFLFQKDPVI